jgi:hypothetical protein
LYIHLKTIRVQRTSDGDRVTFEAAGRNSRKNAAALLAEGLDEQRWPRELRRVTQVALQAAFERGSNRPRIVNFTITHPAGCSLRDSEEELILRRCLQEGGIANHG